MVAIMVEQQRGCIFHYIAKWVCTLSLKSVKRCPKTRTPRQIPFAYTCVYKFMSNEIANSAYEYGLLRHHVRYVMHREKHTVVPPPRPSLSHLNRCSRQSHNTSHDVASSRNISTVTTLSGRLRFMKLCVSWAASVRKTPETG